MRNPKDTAVSLWHHLRSKPEFGCVPKPGSDEYLWETFLDDFIAGNVESGAWIEHVLGWHAFGEAHPDRVCTISYEELLADVRGAADRLARFLGLPPPTAAVLDAVVKG